MIVLVRGVLVLLFSFNFFFARICTRTGAFGERRKATSVGLSARPITSAQKKNNKRRHRSHQIHRHFEKSRHPRNTVFIVHETTMKT